jgi:hypothetical protein
VVEGGPTPTAPVDGPVVCPDCVTACVELVVLDDEVGAGVTGVGVAALELAAGDEAVGAAATGDVVAAEVDVALVEVVVADVGVDPIVEVDPVAPVGAFAAASVVAVTISPLVGVSDSNEDALGS